MTYVIFPMRNGRGWFARITNYGRWVTEQNGFISAKAATLWARQTIKRHFMTHPTAAQMRH